MPYIKQTDIMSLDEHRPPKTPGELNYILTRTCDDYLRHQGLSYQALNDIIGALECAKLEYYRRVAVPYEDVKKQENGDVYWCHCEVTSGDNPTCPVHVK